MIHNWFDEIASQYRDKLALTFRSVKFSYLQLQHESKLLAAYMWEKGVRPEDIVCPLFKRNPYHVILTIALSRLKAIYVALDINQKEKITTDKISGFTEAWHFTQATSNSDRNLSLDEFTDYKKQLSFDELYQKMNIIVSNVEEDDNSIAYIACSSGSTGKPKSIPIPHRGVGYWKRKIKELSNKGELSLKPGEKVLGSIGTAFDASLWEWLVTGLLQGLNVYLVDHFTRLNPNDISQAIIDHHVQHALLIPSQLKIIDNLETTLADWKKSGLTSLYTTGEALTPDMVHLCDKLDIRLVNCYGQTENCFGASVLSVTPQDLYEYDGKTHVPIARMNPDDEVKFHVKKGVIWVETPHGATRYLEDIQQNQTHFETPDKNRSNVTLFYSEDKGVLNGDLLYHTGRASLDSHVKLNGEFETPKRIEQSLKEINRDEPSWLTDYRVLTDVSDDYPMVIAVIPGQNFNRQNIVSHLKSKHNKLPEIIAFEKFPATVNSNGKCDIKALKEQCSQHLRDSSKSKSELVINTQDPIEALKIYWANLFNLSEVDTTECFFALGGDSMICVTLLGFIRRAFDVNLSMQTFYGMKSSKSGASIDNILSALGSNNQNDSMTPVQTNGKTLFLIPPLLGEGVFTFRQLINQLQELDPTLNIVPLDNPSLHDDSLSFIDIPELAKAMLTMMRQHQPNGPYNILGYSFGCSVAQEITHQIQANGDSVEKLILVDGPAPHLLRHESLRHYAKKLVGLRQLVIKLLNNDYYGERISASVTMQDLEHLTQDEQRRMVFHDDPYFKPKTEKGKKVVALAERHLEHYLYYGLMPIYDVPTTVIPCTDTLQDYRDIVQKVVGQDEDHHYHWSTLGYGNRYTNNVTAGRPIHANHISLLNTGASVLAAEVFIALNPYNPEKTSKAVASHEKYNQFLLINNIGLLDALDENNFEKFVLLHHGGASLEVIYDEGQSLLHIACELQREEFVQYILDNGAPMLNALDERQNTPIAISLGSKNDNITQMLIQAGVDVSENNQVGKRRNNTCLMLYNNWKNNGLRKSVHFSEEIPTVKHNAS